MFVHIENIEVIDPINFAVSEAIISNGGTWNLASDGQSGQARWVISRLNAGDEERLTLELDLADSILGGTLLNNQAQVRYDGLSTPILSDDPDTAEILDSTTISVIGDGPLLNLSKTVNPPLCPVQAK